MSGVQVWDMAELAPERKNIKKHKRSIFSP